MDNHIDFAHNWNGKLDNGIYTTIRKYTQEKLLYYDDLKGVEFDIMLGGKVYSTAELIGVGTQELAAIPFGFLAIDTGVIDPDEVYRLFEKFGIKRDDTVIVLLLKTIKRYGHKKT